MRMITLPGTGLSVSRFVFGTGSLHHVAAPAAQALLDKAVEVGFTHFDTAPLYGFGLGEQALAPVLRRYPHLTVTTKVGLHPRLGMARSPAGMLARKALGKLVRPLSKFSVKQDVAWAEISLAGSLKRLKRDFVDIFMLHEPVFAEIQTDEWQRWLENARNRIGAFGLAGEPHRLLPFVEISSPLARVLQARDSIIGDEARPLRTLDRSPQLTYGYLQPPVDDARATLSLALQKNPEGAVLVSTRRIERLELFRSIGG